MTWLGGKVAARWGSHAVRYCDGAMNLAAGVLFFTWWALRKPIRGAIGRAPLIRRSFYDRGLKIL